MQYEQHVSKLFTRRGEMFGVFISPELWRLIKHDVDPIINNALEIMGKEVTTDEPIEDWNTLKAYWDFQYPFNAEVHCDACGNATEDWENDEQHHFRLKAANMGGQVAFECAKCKARVVKRHFKDKITFECKPCECKEDE